MKLMLRPEWRLWPFGSFLGLLDLKTGATIALLFVLLNKVAGVYGLIAVATGSGGSFAQLSLYLYSVVALVALGWGLKAVNEEDPKQTFYLAHLFFADHIFSSSWTVFFAVVWWFQTPHDGRRQVNSSAQQDIIDVAQVGTHVLTDEERTTAAMTIWNHEKGTAFAIILIAWLCKIYFALLIYSYAVHLRQGSYYSLPHSRYAPIPGTNPNNAYDPAYSSGDEEIEDFYRVPLRTPGAGASIFSFTDFVNAPPGRARKTKPAPREGSSTSAEHEEVLFDEDELTYASSSRGHSKLGTDDSSVSSTDEERRKART